jgi:hypothetical protein
MKEKQGRIEKATSAHAHAENYAARRIKYVDRDSDGQPAGRRDHTCHLTQL